MGVDVSLYPVSFGDDEKGYFSFSKLELERRRELWDDLAKVQNHPCTSLTAHLGDSYGKRTEDCYGTSLRYALAADLVSLATHEAVQDNTTNRAVWAYLGVLNPDAKIVLWWH